MPIPMAAAEDKNLIRVKRLQNNLAQYETSLLKSKDGPIQI